MFPVGDEPGALGYVEMFTDMFNALERGAKPVEDFYDGYVVNAIMDAALLSARTKRWEPVALEDWRGDADADTAQTAPRVRRGSLPDQEGERCPTAA